MSLGQDLRTARLNRRLTLSQVAERTRIKFKILDAIENEDFTAVPAPIYAKGFIRLYAECVGLDPQQLIDEYVTRFGPSATGSNKLDKDMFTIDRNGIVTRRESALANLPDEPAPTVTPVTPRSEEPIPSEPAPSVLQPQVTEPEVPFKLVSDLPSVAPTPAPLAETAAPTTPTKQHVQPDLFDTTRAPVTQTAPLPHTAVVTPAPVEMSAPVHSPAINAAPAPIAEPVSTVIVPIENPAPVISTSAVHTPQAPTPVEQAPLHHHAPDPSPKPAASHPYHHATVEAEPHVESPKSERAATSSRTTRHTEPPRATTTAKQVSSTPFEEPVSGFPLKGILITLGTAALLIICLTGIVRFVGGDKEAATVNPAAPVKSPALRLAVEPPQPYFN